MAEFSILGLFSGLLAVTCTEIIAYLLYTKVFDLEFELHIGLWLGGPMLSMILILMISQLYTNQVTRQPPLKALNVAN